VIGDTCITVKPNIYMADFKSKKQRRTDCKEVRELVVAAEASAISSGAQCDDTRARVRMRYFVEFCLVDMAH
jgi:hypothetical protein